MLSAAHTQRLYECNDAAKQYDDSDSADDMTTQCYADIYAQLRAQGTPIPTNDIWIAALAVQHSLPLCSRDEYFNHLKQIARI